jgi:hypothetical protein
MNKDFYATIPEPAGHICECDTLAVFIGHDSHFDLHDVNLASGWLSIDATSTWASDSLLSYDHYSFEGRPIAARRRTTMPQHWMVCKLHIHKHGRSVVSRTVCVLVKLKQH